MKQLLLFTIWLSIAGQSFGQSFKRKLNESAFDFVERTMSSDQATVTGKVLETKWNSQTVIIAFLSTEEIVVQSENQHSITNLEGYVLFQTSDDEYKKVYIDSYEEEGAVAEIASVFFSNADEDEEKELIVLCSWDQNMHAAPISGFFYQTNFYDQQNIEHLNDQLIKLDLDKHFPFEFDGTNDEGTRSKATYTNATKIKQRLTELGY